MFLAQRICHYRIQSDPTRSVPLNPPPASLPPETAQQHVIMQMIEADVLSQKQALVDVIGKESEIVNELAEKLKRSKLDPISREKLAGIHESMRSSKFKLQEVVLH